MFCLVIPIASTLVFFHYQKKQIRREIKHQIIAGIDKQELVLLKFTEESAHQQLKWKHSKEFEYKGSMYDIVEKEVRNDTIYYWCWWDHKETALNKQLNKLLSDVMGQNPQKKEKESQVNKFYASLFCSQQDHWQPLLEANERPSFDSQHPLFFIYTSPPVPPPEIS